ncbi:hypothetical protein [Dyadobacter sp. 32]|uniref:hypothetical protein n=1 Tax=Dyadobacter sp. 32 TaxID=538966 RepID=UPI0011EDC378
MKKEKISIMLAVLSIITSLSVSNKIVSSKDTTVQQVAYLAGWAATQTEDPAGIGVAVGASAAIGTASAFAFGASGATGVLTPVGLGFAAVGVMFAG